LCHDGVRFSFTARSMDLLLSPLINVSCRDMCNFAPKLSGPYVPVQHSRSHCSLFLCLNLSGSEPHVLHFSTSRCSLDHRYSNMLLLPPRIRKPIVLTLGGSVAATIVSSVAMRTIPPFSQQIMSPFFQHIYIYIYKYDIFSYICVLSCVNDTSVNLT